MTTLEKEIIHQKSNILDIFEKNKEYCCLKFKIIGLENKIYMGGILFFEINYDNEIRIFTAKFIDKPRLIFTKYHSVFDQLDIESNWYDFYNEIKKNSDKTLSSYFLFYIQVLKKITSHYFDREFESKRSPGIVTEERKHLISEIKNDVYNFLVKLWSLYKSQVKVTSERINLTLLKHYRDEIAKKKYEQELLAQEKKSDIDWGLDEDLKIKRYLPVISIESGKVAKTLIPGDTVYVCDFIADEDLPHFPYKDRPEFEREVVEFQFDEQNSMRVLVKDQENNYGDLEIFDTLFKIKTQNSNTVVTKKKKWFSSSFWFFLNFFIVILFITFIFVLAKVNFI